MEEVGRKRERKERKRKKNDEESSSDEEIEKMEQEKFSRRECLWLFHSFFFFVFLSFFLSISAKTIGESKLDPAIIKRLHQ